MANVNLCSAMPKLGVASHVLRSTVDHYVLPELMFKDKTPQDMEHVWMEVKNVARNQNASGIFFAKKKI